MAPRIILYVLIIFLLSPFQAEAAAKRIVSLYPGHTDNIVALGGEKRLVAVSKNDDDDMLPGLPRFSAKSGAEEILALKPDLVLTRGLAETTRLALALGGHTTTLSGLSGMGDLVATCSSSLSRNHTAGRLLGAGLTLAQVQDAMTQTAEGIKSAPAVLELARRHGVDMPITEAVVSVLRGETPVHELAPRLLGRDLKSEGNTA